MSDSAHKITDSDQSPQGGLLTAGASTIASMLSIPASKVQEQARNADGYVIRIGPNKYDIIATARNYIRGLKGKQAGVKTEEGIDFHAEKARLTKAQADRQEIEVQKAQGVLVEADKVVKAWVDTIVTTRNRLLAIPQKLSYEISVTDDREEIEKLLMSEMRSALTAMENLQGHNYSEEDEPEIEAEPPKEEPNKKRGRPKKNAQKSY